MLRPVSSNQTTRVTERAIDIVDVLTQNAPQRRLYARWERVNGKRICAWFRTPD